MSKDKKKEGEEKPRIKKQKFFFPDYGLTIEAESKEEAEEIIQELNK